MLEDTNLATGAQILAETLRADYGIDPAEVFAEAGLDMSRLEIPGARYPWPNLRKLWEAASRFSGDPCFGLKAGQRVRISSYHAIGFSWVSSATLLEALERLCRYRAVLSTVDIEVSLAREEPDKYVLADQFNNEANWEAHYDGTGKEIWEATGGELDVVVLTMGTTGTLIGAMFACFFLGLGMIIYSNL